MTGNDIPEPNATVEENDLVDHIGADLWRAFRAFELAMFEEVAQSGFGDITVADSDVLVFVGPRGARLTDIAAQRRVSKQAAHEQIHSLVKRGYLVLDADPEDRRARIVRHTERGRALVAALRAVKQKLHNNVAAELGQDRLKALEDMLATIEATLGPSG
jgi:DNA-binding MarR family transcriptional regulator